MPLSEFAYDLPLRTRFRGITRRQGLLMRGAAGWGEWSPFLDYSGAELVPWLNAAREAADTGWPDPVRDAVPVNCTIPAVDAATAEALAAGSGCRTAKVKVAEPGQGLAADLDRVAAVRSALGPGGRVRVDANGGWTVDAARRAAERLAGFDLEYLEQPCATVDDLAELRVALARAGVDVLVAADESIRRSADPYLVVARQAADVAVLKVQPLGGVRACLEIAERIGLPVVVSSALETSVGLRAGLALAAALPELPYACGLDTLSLLGDDVGEPSVRSAAGVIAVSVVGDVEVGDEARRRCAAGPAEQAFWQARLVATSRLAGLDD